MAVAVCLAVLGSLLTPGCAVTGNSSLPAVRVLFIGNSFTFFNGGIDADLHGLAPRTTVGSATQGGYSLTQHLADPATISKLGEGWTFVVLQDQSQNPVYNSSDFEQSAGRFVRLIREKQGTPMLLMTWERPDSPGVTTEAMRSSVEQVGQQVGATVIPAGIAFADSLSAQPSVVLNQHDGHPTREGTYLAACTAYARIFGLSPVGNTYTGGLDASVASGLQRAAAQAVGK
jgi:hypothetical protein